MYNETPYLKAERLLNEIQQHTDYIKTCYYEIDRLAELYMEGQIDWPVGREQRRYQREIERNKKLIEKKNKEIIKLRQRYGF